MPRVVVLLILYTPDDGFLIPEPVVLYKYNNNTD